MFHHQKIYKNAFCKNSLLNSTSFSPLSKWKKLLDVSEFLSAQNQDGNQGKTSFSKRRSLKADLSVTPLLAGLLAACATKDYVPIRSGGTLQDDDDGSLEFDLYVLDGAIEGARVYVDADKDGQLDVGGEPIGTTDENGRFRIAGEYAGETFLVDVEGARDLFTGEVLPSGILYRASSDASGGSDVVASPISTLIEALREDDPELTDDDILGMIFGPQFAILDIEIADLNNPDNFILPIDGGSKPVGSLGALIEEIAQTNIELQVLLEQVEQEGGDLADVLGEVARDTFNDDGGLTPASRLEADARIDEARLRASGVPLANPQNFNKDEDDGLAIDIEAWGLRDPAGNADINIPSLLARLDIISISFTDGQDNNIDGMLVYVNADGEAAEYIAGSQIPYAHLKDLKLSTADDFFGTVRITYRVFDGEDSSTGQEVLVITVDPVNDDPATLELTGDRLNADGDRRADDGSEAYSYVLSDGKITALDGTARGVLSGTDPATYEDDDNGLSLNFSVGGTHGALFEIDDNNVLQLRADATPLDGGALYEITITVTDSEGGTRTETYEILQGGLYLETGGVRTHANGDGLLDEAADGSAVSILLGGLGIDERTNATSGTPGEAGYRSAIEYTLVDGGADNAQFIIESNELRYIGADSGDYDISADDGGPDSLNVQIQSHYTTLVSHDADFTGTTGIDASGDTADSDDRTFALEGGGLVQTDTAQVDAVAAIVAVFTLNAGADTLRLTADTAGGGGNDIELVIALGTETGAGVAVTDGVVVAVNLITVTLNAEGATLAEIQTALEDNAEAAALVDVTIDGAETTVLTAAIAADDNVEATAGADAVAEIPASREIDIAGGTIYIDDGVSGREISFDAVADLPIDVAGFIIVDDVDGDGTYVARAVAELPADGEYYVIGTVEPLTVDIPATAAIAAVFTLNADADTLRLTADTAGVGGNDIQLAIVLGTETGLGVAVTDGVVVTVNLITVTLNAEGATLAEILSALEDNAEAAALVDVTIVGDDTISLTAAIAADDNVEATAGADEVPATTRDGYAPEGPTGTDQNGGQLNWEQITATTHDYQVNLNNIDDNLPVFVNDTGDAIDLAENDAPDVLLDASATDADNTGQPAGEPAGAPVDVLSYSIAWIGDAPEVNGTTSAAIADYFEINETGQLRLRDGVTLDFETSDTVLNIQITATSTSSLSGNASDITRDVAVTLNDGNDAPTNVSLSALVLDSASLTSGEVKIADLSTADIDAADSFTYAVTGTDANLFEIRADELWYIGGDEELRGEGHTYDVSITTTDSGDESFTQEFTVTQSGLYLIADGTRVYTQGGVSDDDVTITSLIDEEVNGSGAPSLLGELGDHSGANAFVLEGANADDFTIIAGFDAVITTSVETVSAVASSNTNGAQYVILAADGSAVTLSETATGNVIGQLDGTAGGAAAALAWGVTDLTIFGDDVSLAAGTYAAGNRLLYIGTDSGDFDVATPQALGFTLKATQENDYATAVTDFAGRVYADANNDAADTVDTRQFHWTGAAMSNVTDTSIDVAAGSIYLPDADTVITWLEALNIVKTADVHFILVDDVDGDGTYVARAVTGLPESGEFYVLGTVENAIATANATGTAQASGGLKWISSTATYDYQIVRGNVDDNAPVFDNDTGDAIDLAENDAPDVLLDASATDADNTGQPAGEPTDTLTYSIAWMGTAPELNGTPSAAIADYFEIDETGQLRLKDGVVLDFETSDTDLNIQITATSTSSLSGDASDTTRDVTVTLMDENEAPTALSLSRSALIGGSTEVGALSVSDEDLLVVTGRTNTDTHVFELVADTAEQAGATDTALFAIDADGTTLRFIGLDGDASAGGDVPGDDGRKEIGDSYLVRVKVTDSGGLEFVTTLTIGEGEIYLFDDADGSGAQNGTEEKIYSAGAGLLPESFTLPTAAAGVSIEGAGQLITLTAQSLGSAGNNIDIVIVEDATITEASGAIIEVSGDVITLTFRDLDTQEEGQTAATPQAIKTLIEADTDASNLVTVSAVSDSEVADALTAQTYALADGSDANMAGLLVATLGSENALHTSFALAPDALNNDNDEFMIIAGFASFTTTSVANNSNALTSGNANGGQYVTYNAANILVLSETATGVVMGQLDGTVGGAAAGLAWNVTGLTISGTALSLVAGDYTAGARLFYTGPDTGDYENENDARFKTLEIESGGSSSLYRILLRDDNEAPTLTLSDGSNNRAGTLVFDDVDGGDTLLDLQVLIGNTDALPANIVTEVRVDTSKMLAGNGTSAAIADGSYGSFTFTRAADDNGSMSWVYTLNETLTGLGANDTARDDVWVRVNDGALDSPIRNIYVVIDGIEDRPILSPNFATSVVENNWPTKNGTFTFTDADADDSVIGGSDSEISIQARATTTTLNMDGDAPVTDFTTGTGDDALNAGGTAIRGVFGTLYLGIDGQWRYVLDDTDTDTQGLHEGLDDTEIFEVQLLDADGEASEIRTITLSVAGREDRPVLSANQTGAATEDETTTDTLINGTFTFTDEDADDSVIGGSGSEISIQARATTIASNTDGDEPVTAFTTGLGLNVQASGGLAIRGVYGTLYFGSNGQWRYEFDETDIDQQALNTDNSGQEIFEVQLLDADGEASEIRTITINITGVNDAPVFTTAGSAVTIDENTNTQMDTGITYTGSDVDDMLTAASFTVSEVNTSTNVLTTSTRFEVVGDSTNGFKLVLAAGNGDNLDFEADSGSTITLRVGASDGKASAEIFTDVIIQLNDVNDPPTADTTATNYNVLGAVTEDTVLTASGEFIATDEEGDTLSYSIQSSPAGNYGTLTLGTNGQWSYTLDNTNTAVQALAGGASETDTFTLRATDSAGLFVERDVTITITGTNDAPTVIGGTSAGGVTEDAVDATATGTFQVTDVDSDDAALSYSAEGVNYGTMTFADDGSWTYTLDNTNTAVQALGMGVTMLVFITLRATDSDGASSGALTVIITITGVDDVPTADTTHADYDVTDTYESGDLEAASGRWVVEDADEGDTLSYDVQAQGDYGTLRFGTDGNWGYAIDTTSTDIQNLNDSNNPTTLTDTITVRATDEAGAFVDGTVTVTINDATNTSYVNGTSGDDGSNSNYIGTSSSATEQIVQGGDGTDYLQGGTADDIIIGGAGNDTISLNHGGNDRVIYRIASTDDGLFGSDGNDTIDNFNFTGLGIDSLVFVDTDDTPLGIFSDLLELGIGNDPQLTVSLIPETGDTGYSGMVFTFLGDTTTSTDDATLTLNFKEILIATGATGIFGDNGITNNQVNDIGLARFAGSYGATYDVVALEEFGIDII